MSTNQTTPQLTYTGQVEGGSLSDSTLQEIITAATVPLGIGYGPLTALSGGAQAGATQLQLGLNRVVTVAAGADSVLLPPATPGSVVVVTNANVTNAVAVFAAGATDIINALANGTALSVAAAATTFFFCTAAGKWNSK